MAETTTTKTINVSQLCSELNGVTLFVVGPAPDGTTKITAPSITDQQLAAAVAAHVANPNWVNPNPGPPAPPSKRDIAAQKIAAVPNGPMREALNALLDVLR